VTAQDAVEALWREPLSWQRHVLSNLAGMGRFSSDRAVAEYAREVWKVSKVEVCLPEGPELGLP
jgi:glycogen phosphorylase